MMAYVLEVRVRVRKERIWSTYFQGHQLESHKTVLDALCELIDGNIDEVRIDIVYPGTIQGWSYDTEIPIQGGGDVQDRKR